MQYLTNYYRNLCEQLQEKLNILEGQLNELNFGPDGIEINPTDSKRINRIKKALSGGGVDKNKLISKIKPSHTSPHDQPYADQNKHLLKLRKLSPGYKYGLDGKPVFVGDTEPIKPYGFNMDYLPSMQPGRINPREMPKVKPKEKPIPLQYIPPIENDPRMM